MNSLSEAEMSTQNAQPVPGQRTLSCLLVDDSNSDLVHLASNLEQLGHRAEGLQDPRLVEQELAKGPFDLLFLDVVMPDRNGYAILRAVRQLYPRLPVVIVSSKAQDSDVNWAFLQGASGYLIKPYSQADLALCLARFVEE